MASDTDNTSRYHDLRPEERYPRPECYREREGREPDPDFAWKDRETPITTGQIVGKAMPNTTESWTTERAAELDDLIGVLSTNNGVYYMTSTDLALLLAARAELALRLGAMQAQDQREQAAGAKCGVPYEEHGCDWPDAVASYLAEVTRQRDVLRAACEAIDNHLMTTFPPYRAGESPFNKVRAALAQCPREADHA